MTIQRAEQLLRELQGLLQDESQRGARRRPSLLPASKAELLCAIKLSIAQLYLIGADDDRRIDPIKQAAMALDSFTDTPVGATEFLERMVDRRREINEFREQLRQIPPNNQFFWQQVYSLVGIEMQTKRATFFQSLQQRMKLGPKAKPEGTSSNRPAYDYAAGRYDLDA